MVSACMLTNDAENVEMSNDLHRFMEVNVIYV